MKNVLIISHSFPPLNNIAARRFGDMVKYMETFGWRPYVITTEAYGDLKININNNQIIRIGGHHQKNLKIAKKRNKLSFQLNIVRNILNKLNFHFGTLDSTFFGWRKEVITCKNLLNKLPPIHIIIASYGPPASLWIGRYLAKKLKVPWIADFRDLGALKRENDNKILFGMDLLLEKHLLRTSKAITTVSESLALLLNHKYNKKSYVIYNGFDEIKNDCCNSENEKGQYIYYAGRFYLHRLPSIYLLLKAMKNIHVLLNIRSLGPVEIEDKILVKARELGIEERIKILPPAETKQIHEESRNALINIVIEDLSNEHEWSKGTLTGKFLQLLPYRTPILAIARQDNEMGKILKETNKGILCSNLQDIEIFIRSVLEGNTFSGNNSIKKYSKYKQAEILCSIMDSLVNKL